MIIRRIKGDTYPLDITILDVSGNPFPLTGCTVFFTVKRNIQDTDAQALISKNITSYTDPVNGQASIPLLASDVDYSGDFYYDVKVKNSGGVITSAFKDKFCLVEHITIRTV